jgi:hypothetical protein
VDCVSSFAVRSAIDRTDGLDSRKVYLESIYKLVLFISGGNYMRISQIVFAIALSLCFALPLAAQYIGILQSAETMNRGTYKLMLAPIMVFGKDGADDELGVAVRGGYAFTEHFEGS